VKIGGFHPRTHDNGTQSAVKWSVQREKGRPLSSGGNERLLFLRLENYPANGCAPLFAGDAVNRRPLLLPDRSDCYVSGWRQFLQRVTWRHQPTTGKAAVDWDDINTLALPLPKGFDSLRLITTDCRAGRQQPLASYCTNEGRDYPLVG
jgi:hypothetical protein